MTVAEAIELIRPAVESSGGSWADFGAGSGLFTRALASLLGPSGLVYAVDSDARATAALRSLAARPSSGAQVIPIDGDFRQLDRIDALVRVLLDGALFANALHFVPDAGRILRELKPSLRVGGPIVVVEYDGRPANRWVPHPLPLAKLREISTQLSLRPPRVIGERPSAYGGIMYCAVLEGPTLHD